tara:strand:- start:125 stop:634 length:510 start_codon:yes stop_codon:yes gene_type:complete
MTNATKTLDWNQLAKKSGYSPVEITLEDGTPNGTMKWYYMRGFGCDCWIVTRHDNEGNQVAEGNYTAIRRNELADVLKEMGSQTITQLDPYHHNSVEAAVAHGDLQLEDGVAGLTIELREGKITVQHPDGCGSVLLQGHAPKGTWAELCDHLCKSLVNAEGPMTRSRGR